MSQPLPPNFITFNNQNSKQLNVVVDIQGLPYLSTLTILRPLEYGDIISYGDAGIVYGGMAPFGSQPGERQQKIFLIADSSSLTISQRLEPEQGRGSISTLNLNFLDKDGQMTKLVSPGQVVPDILGLPVKIWIGFQNTSFPNDYYVVWRGRVAQVNAKVGQVGLQLVDPNVIRRQQVLLGGTSTLVGNVPASNTTVPATYSNASSAWTSAAHGLTTSDQVFLTVTGGALPTGYNGYPFPYYIINPTTNTFQLSTSPNGQFVATTNSGSGTFTATWDASYISVASNAAFFTKIAMPQGGYDTSVRLFILIDNEFIEYQQTGSESTGFGVDEFIGVYRVSGLTDANNLQKLLGVPLSNPYIAAEHSDGSTVTNYMYFTGHALDIALKLMMSGFSNSSDTAAAPYLTGQSIHSLVTTDDSSFPTFSNGIVLPTNTDAIRDLGIAVGDYIKITGDSHPGNNVQCQCIGFNDLSSGQTNNVILTNVTFTASDPSSAAISITSQYNTYPSLAGCALPGYEVDVPTFQYYRNTFLANPNNAYTFLINGPETGKTFIESEILLPLGAYSLTRQGRLSMGLTKPPLPTVTTQILNISNVLDPSNITIQRGVNNRKYFNEVDWSFDCDETNSATNQDNFISAESLALIGISTVLPITSRGARSNNGFLSVVQDRTNTILARYQNAAVLLDLKTNLETGVQIEAGDEIVVNDNGQLQIPNFSTGVRNLGSQFFEVINRNLDLRTGETQLQLEGGVGATPTNRFGTISPSSLLLGTQTSSRIVITESFGNTATSGVFPGNEQKKWQNYIGLKVTVHSPDWLVQGTTVFTGFDSTNTHALFLSPALSFTPQSGWILDLAYYPTNSNPSDQALAKLLHAHIGPSVAVTAGISGTKFTVGAADIAKFATGQTILLHNPTYSILSQEVTITGISGDNITVSATLMNTEASGTPSDPSTWVPFFPDASLTVELIGFADGGQSYRFI